MTHTGNMMRISLAALQPLYALSPYAGSAAEPGPHAMTVQGLVARLDENALFYVIIISYDCVCMSGDVKQDYSYVVIMHESISSAY